MVKDKGAKDDRLDWIKKKVETSFRNVQGKKVDQFISKADNVTIFQKFLNQPEEQNLFIGYKKSGLEVSLTPFEIAKGKGLVIFKKPDVSAIGVENINDVLIVEEYSDALIQTNILLNQVYLPLVKNQKNVKGWPKVVSQDVRQQFDKFSAQLDMFVGHTKGETVLPVPPIETTTSHHRSKKKTETTLSPSNGASTSTISPKDVDRSTIHALESSIIDWTREIKKSIETEPEKALNIAESRKKYHGPKFELNFWKLKSHNLQNLFAQLNTDKVNQVVTILQKTNSTYVETYSRMFEELKTSMAEATSIHKHLQPLNQYIDSLTNADEPEDYHLNFRPILHMISLIWDSCEHYDQLKLISLLRQVCNDIISTIYNHVDPSSLWESEVEDSEARLKTAIKNCEAFMKTFSHYRSKVNEKYSERPDRQWNFEKQTVFRRFNAFTERLHDLLDVVLHVKDFVKLERVEIGGIKGEMLTVMVRQVYEEFKEAQEKMQRSDYDLLDLTLPHFDNDFYQFRSAILDFDKRLCYVIDKGYRFCPIPATAFKLLESFESQLRRDMIRSEVFEKYIKLMDLYTQDLTAVYHIFNSHKESPPVLSNLPRVSGSIAWVNALIDRISWPYNKLKHLPEEISSHPNMKSITKKYTYLVKQMRQFEKSVYKTWVANVERISREKLNETIMKRLSDRRLSLNFDPQLTSCIQEVKYLNLFSMEVPDSATAVYDRKDDFRHFTGQLEVIVRQYNTVIQTVMDVERPLIQDRLSSIDQLMERPLQQLNWTSSDISSFIDEASTRVNDLYSRLNFLKGNVKTIRKMIKNWMNLYEVITSNKEVEEEETSGSTRIVRIATFWRNKNNLFNVPNQTLTNKIFLQWREKTSTAIYSPADVVEQGARIHKIVRASLKKIEADPTNPDWVRYVQYLDQTVQHGLTRSIEHCLQYLIDTMSPVTQMTELGTPSNKGFTVLMDSKLEFLNNNAMFKPSIEPDDRESVQTVVQYWLDRVFTITSKIHKLSDTSETFGAISESQELLGIKDQVEDLLQSTIDKMMDLRNTFTQYAHLWEEDPKDLIQSLYDQAREEEQLEADAQENKDGNATSPNAPQRLPLVKFDEEIQHYEQLHEEIMQLPELVCFGWISIDTSPIRYAISTLAKKWRFALLDYMEKDVKQQLSQFSEFIENMKAGLSQEVPKDDYPKLVEMMGYLMDIQERPEFTNESHFEPFRETVALLKKYEIKVPTDVIQQLDDAKPLWKSLLKQFYEVKDKLSVLQNAEIKKISSYESDFIDAAEHYRKQFLNEDMFKYEVGVDRAYILMDQVHLQLMKRESELEDLRKKQKLFGLIQNPGTPVVSSRNDLKTLKKIWDVVAMVLWQIEDWKSIPFLKIDTDVIEDQVKKFSRSMKTIDKRAKKWNVYTDLESSVNNFQRTLPLVHDLRNEGMRDRHWQMLMNKTGVKFELSANFKLENLLELNLHKFEEDVQEIVDRADKEIKLEAQLKQFEANWVSLAFDLDSHKDVKIVRVPEEVVETLEDNQVQLQNIASMRFNDFFIDQIEEWVKKLGMVDTNMYLLLDVQKKWQYLETIFIGSEDIREQLPEESKRFDSIDTELRRILKTAEEDPNIIHFTQQSGLEEDLLLLQEKLGMCENKLTAYLEEKKKIFPRFYFTSIVDLLDILSKGGQAPHLIMKHMAKLFQAIKTLIFEKDAEGNPTNVAVGLIGNKKEEILMFKTPITLEGKVEDWLNALKEHIKETLRLYLAESIVSYEEQPRHEWLVGVNAQLVLVAAQLYWTSEVLQAFEALEENNENAMKDYYDKQVDQLNHLILAVQGDLDKKLRMKIMNLITIDVHARDIVDRLIKENVTNNQAFLWQSQLRQRWDENEKDCFINICDAQFRYGYEFLGNGGRLVITPLTDRIYITLTQALHLIMGGAPAGPAGTGKTETTKDLGSQLGISTLVFNCVSKDSIITVGNGNYGYRVEELFEAASCVRTPLDNGSKLNSKFVSVSDFQSLNFSSLSTSRPVDEIEYVKKLIEEGAQPEDQGTPLVLSQDGKVVLNKRESEQDSIDESDSASEDESEFESEETTVVEVAEPSPYSTGTEAHFMRSQQTRAKAIVCNRVESKMLSFTLVDGTKFSCTLDHQIYVVEPNGELCFKKAQEVDMEHDRVVRGPYPFTEHVPPVNSLMSTNAGSQQFISKDILAACNFTPKTLTIIEENEILPIHMDEVDRIAAFARLTGAAVCSGIITESQTKLIVSEWEDAYNVVRDARILLNGAHMDCRPKKIFQGTIEISLGSVLSALIQHVGGVSVDSNVSALWTDAPHTWIKREFLCGAWGSSKSTIQRTEGAATASLVCDSESHASVAQMMVDIGFEKPSAHSKGNTVTLQTSDNDFMHLMSTINFAYAAEKRRELLPYVAYRKYREHCSKQSNKMSVCTFDAFYEQHLKVDQHSQLQGHIPVPIFSCTEATEDSTYDITINSSDEGLHNFEVSGVVMHNCSDQMDNKSLGDIFKGLASSGSFGCFDEFNRISVEVLSVVSTQFKSILDALKEKKTRFLFERDEISLDPNVGVFITMNPGYLGRTALPESLKALFRPVTVVVPDFDLICENMLMAEGFIDAKVLSQKFITLYRLNADLLSKQSHYDWGLRAIKSVLVVAGALKRAEPEIPESHILMRALRDFNLPKIVPTDLDVFMGLVHDLFPGIELDRKQDKDFESCVAKTLTKNKLQPEEGLVLKIVQLQEIMEVRHSVFIIGPAGSGKSTIWKNLADAQTSMSDKVTIKDLNPKAITSHELYGRFNEVTGDWKDGLMSTTMRDLANIEDVKPKWIILDGDLDTEWIESMNSVMDDNRILTLANNDRIPLLQHMKLIFEIAHLKYATPATVSRAGILFVDKADIGWQPYVASWIDKRPTAERAHMTIFFDRYVAETLFHIQRNFKFVLEQNAINMVETLCRLLEGLLTEENVPPGTDKEVYEMYFAFAAVWAFGGPLGVRDGVDYRKQFDKWWRMTWRNQIKFPDGGTVFDFYLDAQSKKFERWSNKVEKFDFDPEVSLANMMVPTEETTSVKFFMDMMIPMGYPVLLVGNAGCGKTKLVEQQLATLNKEEYENRTINFNYYTGAENLQMVMESNLEKKGGKRYGPPGSKRMVFFIDDLNMPLIDAYGTQTPIALLRQHMDYSHWYERTKWTLREISKVQYLCSMNPTAGSFTVNDRLQRHFVTFAINFPADSSLTTIYQQILDGHLSNFAREVSSLSDGVVKATLDLHKKVAKEFTKTASNFHYEFNLRHLSNVFSGLLQSQPAQFRKAGKFAQLWTHEVTRVYHDLLSTTRDTETFNKILGGVINQYFAAHNETINELPINVFTHFANGIGEKAYDCFNKVEDLKKTLEDALEDHNRQRTTMDLVLFEDAMKHVCRINRIIETGNALLVGVGGSGKQSLSRLAAFISDYDVYQITITRGYNVDNLKEDLRAMYKKAGQKGEGLIFLFTDTQIVDERFLVYINDLLSSGNIPDLFAPEDVDEIVNSLRTEVKSAGIVDLSNANVWRYFIQKVRQYLHVVLCFSPVGEDLRVRARKFPALVNCTQIDWFFGWPEDALLSVADRFLKDEALGEHVDAVVQFMAFSQKTVEELSAEFKIKMKRYNYTTPKSFLEFIKLYKSLLRANLDENEQQINRLQGGIDKLESTTTQVSELEQVLVGQQKVVAEKKKETEEMLEVVGKDKAIVEEENAKAKIEEEKTEAIAAQVTEKEATCRTELEKAEPMVKAAASALDTLDKKELTEMRSFGNPPSAVVNVMCAVIVLLSTKKVPRQKELTWAAAQKLMSKGADKFLQELKEYDKEHIPDATVKAVRPFLADPEFDPDIIRGKSNAAAGLCFWVQNIVAFHDINKKVIPLRQDQAMAEKELAKAENQLKKVKSKVKKLNDKLAGLEAEFAAKEQEKADIIAKAKKTEDSLALAQRLVKALASESVRWKQSIKSLKEDRLVILGDVLLGAAFVSYAGSFDITFRAMLRERLISFIKEKKIPSSPDLSVVKVLTDDARIAKWGNEGLPNDITSIENGCILTRCERWPLMIDPQLQGITWIRGRIKNKLHVVRLGTKKLVETMERAIQNGDTVLVENIGEDIDAVLSPIIKREITKRGRSKFITLDNEVEYDDNFRLIFHTKYANPHYIPEIQAETTLINFSVTMKGLEDQLLATVVSKERADLEQKRMRLIEQMNEFKIKIKELEDALLENLQNAGDDILEDIELIENLEKTKETSAEIKVKVEQGKVTEVEINEARERYREVAARGSLLYFLLDELKLIHSFYKYSLSAFETVFVRAIAAAKKSDDLKERIENLIDSITYQVYKYTCRGLFESHKLIFVTNLCFKVHSKDLDAQELKFLMTGEKDLQPPENPFTDWLSEDCWQMVCTLATLPAFTRLVDDMQGSTKRWAIWSMYEAPERQKLPQDWKNKSHLQRLCVIRAIRPDRLTHAMREFVGAKMGRRYIDSIPFALDQIYAESNPSTPLFFILSPGANPVKQIEALGKKLGFSDENSKFANIALGRGQEKRAEEELDRAYKHGGWVVLQNIHLMQKWLPTLERKLEKLASGSHKDFRVYLSAEPHPVPLTEVIPQSILQNSIKLTNEPPEDLKSNILRAFANFNQETLESCIKQNEFKTILFTLCFFHAIVLGRRKFGFQGWSTPYSFNMGDLTISADVLYNYLEANDDIPWDDIKYIFGEIMYGGHITDHWDRRTCSTYLDIYMNDRLFDGAELGPGFPTPQPMNYDEYIEYLDKSLPDESPMMFGLHSNAEITYLSQQSAKLFDTLITLTGGVETEGEGQTKEEIVNEKIDFILPQLPEDFNMEEIYSRVDKRTPYVNVCLQECERMNLLLNIMRTSLIELQQGLSGALTISEQMDQLLNDLYRDKVPTNWALFPSLRGLGEWFQDVLKRIQQLEEWSSELQLPKVVWLSGLFNPQSFLTAIMQTAGRKTNSPLNDMVLQTEVTKKMDPSEFSSYPRDGCYIHGLSLEGAGWDLKSGVLCESKLKELRARMPVIHVKAIQRDKVDHKNVYLCPVYVTSMRGGFNYVFTAQLKTKVMTNGGVGGAAYPLDSSKLYTMRGVCLLLT